MAYNPPIATHGAAEVFTHNKADIAPGGSFIVGYGPDPDLTLWQVLGKASCQELREIFGAAVNPLKNDQPEPALVILHAVDKNSEVVDTNSKLPKLHIHSFVSDFGPDFTHMKEHKSWVTTPNPNLEHDIKALIGDNNDSNRIVTHLIDEQKEAERHQLLIMPRFKNMADLVKNGTDEDINRLRKGLKDIITPFITGERKGGCRLIIDERYMNTGALVVQTLGGANLDRTGQGLRYFQNPAPTPT